MDIQTAENVLAEIRRKADTDPQNAARMKVELMAAFILAIAETRIEPKDVLRIARAIRDSWLKP